MKRLILLCAMSLGTCTPLMAVAEDMGDMKMDHMSGVDANAKASSKKTTTAHGVGTIKAIDAKAQTVKLAHGPIAELKWPGMTMAFKVADAKLLEGLAVGQKVAFTLESSGMANSVITAISPAQ